MEREIQSGIESGEMKKIEKPVMPLPRLDPVFSTSMVSVFRFFKFGAKYDLGLGIFVRLD